MAAFFCLIQKQFPKNLFYIYFQKQKTLWEKAWSDEKGIQSFVGSFASKP